MNYGFQDQRALVGHDERVENNRVEVRDSKETGSIKQANPAEIGEHDVLCGRGGLSNAHGKWREVRQGLLKACSLFAEKFSHCSF